MYEYLEKVRPAILAQSKQETEQLFISPKGGTDQSNYVTALMRQVKHINPQIKNAQQLRASVIVKWLRTHHLRKTQYLAGHTYISSTEAYLINDTESLTESVQQYHPMG
jgi:integrase/recombinase XerD